MNILSIVNISVLIILLIVLIKYLFPFARPLWLPFNAFWGYRIGKKKFKSLNMMYIGNNSNFQQNANVPDELEKILEKFTKQMESIINDELNRVEKAREEKGKRLSKDIDETKEKIKTVRTRFSNQVDTAKGHFLGKIISHFNSTFNKNTGKNLLFFIAACIIIIIDTIIAVDIIESLGLFEKNVDMIGLPNGLLYFIGSFITISVALSLHIFLGPGFIDKIFTGKHSRKAVAAFILLVFSILLTMMVFYPSQAKVMFEIVLRFSWLLGVIAVSWLIGQILGDDHDYKLLFVTISMLFLPILYPIFGFSFLLELFFSSAWNIVSSLFLEAKKSRFVKQEQNLNEGSEYFIKGISRGARP